MTELIHKKNLYDKLLYLKNEVSEYRNYVENLISDVDVENKKIRVLTKKLLAVDELIKEFMLLKFQKSSYSYCLLFYHRAIAALDIILDVLKKIEIK